MNSENYKDKILDSEMNLELLPPDYQAWLDSLVSAPEPETFEPAF